MAKRRYDLLRSIPAIGDLTAARLLAELPQSLQSSRQAVAYAGLCPAHFQSGSSICRKASLSKRGNAHLRRALYMPAIVALRFNPLLKAFAQRLLAKGKPKMVVIAALMRKLLALAFAVLKSNRPFDPHFSPCAS